MPLQVPWLSIHLPSEALPGGLDLTPLSLFPVKSSCLSQPLWPTASWMPCWET